METVSYKVAKAMHDFGFYEDCLEVYHDEQKVSALCREHGDIKCPTYLQVWEWMSSHGLAIDVLHNESKVKTYIHKNCNEFLGDNINEAIKKAIDYLVSYEYVTLLNTFNGGIIKNY